MAGEREVKGFHKSVNKDFEYHTLLLLKLTCSLATRCLLVVVLGGYGTSLSVNVETFKESMNQNT